MNINLEKFFREQHVELAVDTDTGTNLLGIPFDYGGAGHTRYYAISAEDFRAALIDERHLRTLERNGTFLGSGRLCASTFVADQVEVAKAQQALQADAAAQRGLS